MEPPPLRFFISSEKFVPGNFHFVQYYSRPFKPVKEIFLIRRQHFATEVMTIGNMFGTTLLFSEAVL